MSTPRIKNWQVSWTNSLVLSSSVMGVLFVRTFLPISGRVVLKGCQYYSVHCDSVYPYCARLSQRLKVYICYMLKQYVST